jgi:hypothetical protein
MDHIFFPPVFDRHGFGKSQGSPGVLAYQTIHEPVLPCIAD